MTLSTEYVVSSLQSLYGDKVTTSDIRGWCAMNGYTYATITKKLNDYKTGRGKWNLTVQEKLEEAYQAPAVENHIEQNLIPEKDDTFVQFGNFSDLKTVSYTHLTLPTTEAV